MRPPRPTRPHLALALVACLLLTGCELAQGPAPRRTIDPSASPIIETEDDFCAALDVLENEHQILREIRLRPGNRRALTDQFDQLDLAWDEVKRLAPRGMGDQIDVMSWAVIELGLAVEDYTTTSRFDEAADHVLRKDIAFDKAIGRLRARTTCLPWAPTPRPAIAPPPSPSPIPSRSPLPGPSGSARSARPTV